LIGVNSKYCVLSKFRVNKLFLNQELISSIREFKSYGTTVAYTVRFDRNVVMRPMTAVYFGATECLYARAPC